MLKDSWSVHCDMEDSEKPVQNQKKKRSQSDKIGRLKEVEEVKLMLRTIFAGLKGLSILSTLDGKLFTEQHLWN